MHVPSRLAVLIVAVVVGTSLLFFSVILYQYLTQSTPFLSPLATDIISPLNKSPAPYSSQKIVYGFLPYWQTKTYTRQHELTHLAFFSLTLNADGTIKTREGLSQDPGYRYFDSNNFSQLLEQNMENDVKSELVLSLFDDGDLAQLLQSTKAQTQALETIHDLLSDSSIQGLNIDFEYTGENPTQLQPEYTRFISSIAQLLDEQFPQIVLSIDVYPSSIEANNIWDIGQLEPYVDYVIVMAYDFHRSSSQNAGPVAPLLSDEQKKNDKNIANYIAQFTKKIPAQKILLGVPFYGYEWQVVSSDPRSKTYPKTGSTASYQRVQDLISQSHELSGFEHLWEYTTLSPYITFQEAGKQKIIYYENQQSLEYKLDFVLQSDLAGIAIWALGYEGNDRTLWTVIRQYFNTVK